MQAPRQEPPTYRQQYNKHDGCDDGQPATMASLRRPATSTSGLRACTALSLYPMALPLFLLMLHITLNVQDYLMAPYAICQDARFLYRI